MAAQILLEKPQHAQAGAVSPGRKELGETQTIAAFLQAGAALLLPPSSIALAWEEGNPQAGGTNRRELFNLPPPPPPDGSCHGKILPAPLRGWAGSISEE